MPLTETSMVTLFAQSPFGLTWSWYVEAPPTGSHENTTSVTLSSSAGSSSWGVAGQV